MNRTLVKFLSIFIFNKQRRKAFRKKHIRIPENTKRVAEMQETLRRLEYKQKQEAQRSISIQSQLKNLARELQEYENRLKNLDSVEAKSAKGLNRVFQLIALEVLKDIDRVCRKHGIRYWLDYGTLLGAIRHGGFIPWDDDLDISMPWDDYMRFQQLDASEFECAIPHFQTGLWGKVYHKDFFDPWPNSSSVFAIFVDIFPYHYLNESYTADEAKTYMLSIAKEKVSKINERKRIPGAYNASFFAAIHPEFAPKEEKLVSARPSNYLFMSLSWPWQTSTPRIPRTKDIFPLKEIKFEGYSFLGPAQPEIWLTCVYGAWWEEKIYPSHMNFNEKKIEEIEKLCQHGKRLGLI